MSRAAGWLVAVTTLSLAAGAQADTLWKVSGWMDLVERVGWEDLPTGAGVVVTQVEAGNGGPYGPNQAHVEFAEETFFAMSGPPGTLNHATTVGQLLYGAFSSLSPSVSQVYLYDASGWVQGEFLNMNGGEPAPTPGGTKLFNHSWIGTVGALATDKQLLRRADYVVTRDDVFMAAGVNNGGAQAPLMAYMFNGIVVGVRPGVHTSSDVAAGHDYAGRMIPHIVAPHTLTSYATPIVNACAALLVETARDPLTLGVDPDAERSEVVKAILLAGAVHEDVHDSEWSNNAATAGPGRGTTATPIDDVVGVGTVNINNSHLILTAGRQPGASAPPGAAATRYGWDLVTVETGASAYWRFTVGQPADEISIAATWHRNVSPGTFSSWNIADIDLTLWRSDGKGGLLTLVGDAGLGWFDGGNIVSESAIDNIEHLHITGLAAGEYVLQASRLDSNFFPWEVAVAWMFPDLSFQPEDINHDFNVGFADLTAVLLAWGPCSDCPEDVDDDGNVGFSDLTAVLLAWD